MQSSFPRVLSLILPARRRLRRLSSRTCVCPPYGIIRRKKNVEEQEQEEEGGRRRQEKGTRRG